MMKGREEIMKIENIKGRINNPINKRRRNVDKRLIWTTKIQCLQVN